jgi:tRNA pseudouridine55 synthase
MATGLLPMRSGQATKFSHALLEAEKSYSATVRLGIKTTTGDLEGEVVRAIDCRLRRSGGE